MSQQVRRRQRRRALVIGAAAVVAAGAVGGVPARAVSGGSPVTDTAYAFAAKVAFGDVRACSGALVAPQWVLTARSCLSEAGAPVAVGAPARPTTVTVGRLDLTTGAGHVRKVNKVVPHPDRNLALVRLAAPAGGVTPVVLATTAPARPGRLDPAAHAVQLQRHRGELRSRRPGQHGDARRLDR